MKTLKTFRRTLTALVPMDIVGIYTPGVTQFRAYTVYRNERTTDIQIEGITDKEIIDLANEIKEETEQTSNYAIGKMPNCS